MSKKANAGVPLPTALDLSSESCAAGRSDFPHGYFIVKEENAGGDLEYVASKGDFGNRYGVVGDRSVNKGRLSQHSMPRRNSL